MCPALDVQYSRRFRFPQPDKGMTWLVVRRVMAATEHAIHRCRESMLVCQADLGWLEQQSGSAARGLSAWMDGFDRPHPNGDVIWFVLEK